MTYAYDRRAVRLRLLYAHLKAAMSVPDAEKILGVSSTATPEEINRAYKKKVFEHHPDRGGDAEKMVEVNVAKEILEGKRRPEHEPYGGHGGEPSETYYRPTPQPKVEKKVVTFADAERKAGVPSGVSCIFKTATRYHSFDGETTNGGTAGFVVYGKTDSAHVFVGVEHYRRQDLYAREDSDLWSMKVYEFPISHELAKVAPRAIRQAFSDFQWVKESFNSKVQLLDGIPFNDKVYNNVGASISFKDAMVQLGAIGEDDPMVKDRKLSITFAISSDYEDADRQVILIINGKAHPLGKDAYQKMKKNRVIDSVFGTYWYSSSKKVLTRSPKAQPVLQWMLKHLTLNEDVKGLLETALAQQTK